MTILNAIKPPRVDLTSVEQMQLFAAVTQNNIAQVKTLLRAGVPVNSADDEDDTPLTLAAAHGFKGMVETLLAHGADVHLPGLSGRSALRAAIDGQHRDVMHSLLEAGADPMMKSYSSLDRKDVSDCMAAASSKDTEIVFAVNFATDSFLMIEAVKSGTAWKVAEWLGRDNCVVDAVNRHGVTAMLHACEMGRMDLVEMLWHAGADPSKPCKYDADITPLRMAEESKNPHLIRQVKEYIQKAEQDFKREATELGKGVSPMKPIRFKPKPGSF
jgi:ankyrin repeat protein